MALETLVAGRYAGTYNAVDVGITENGYEIEQESKAEMVEESDAYGASAIDAIYRGGVAFLMFDSLAYKAGSTSPYWPWGSMGVMLTAAAPMGRLASDVAQAMVLTAAANTPAAAAPATLTAPKSILAPNQSARLLFSTKLRKVPVRLQLLPTLSAGTVVWFTLT